MAAVLACGRKAAVSHESAGFHWGTWGRQSRGIEISVPRQHDCRPHGLTVHRRTSFGANDVTQHNGIPVTTVTCTLIDLAPRLSEDELERSISDAASQGLTDPDRLLSVLETTDPRPGTAVLRRTLTKHTFTLTDTELERRFVPIALKAGLSMPLTQQWLNGYRVDFYWPDLGLVVEADSLRWHRTPYQQRKDRLRDQAHTVAGLTNLRFTHYQVTFEPSVVEETLRQVAQRLVNRTSDPRRQRGLTITWCQRIPSLGAAVRQPATPTSAPAR